MVGRVPSDGETRETLRAVVAQRVATLAAGEGPSPGLERFVADYLTHGALDDLALADADQLAHAALAHWQLGAQRAAGRAIVRVYTPTAASDGWDAPHSIVDIVNDDMPFLVDSLTMAIDRHDLGVHLVVHPVLARAPRRPTASLARASRRRDRAAATRARVVDAHRDRPRDRRRTSSTRCAPTSNACSPTCAPRPATG